MDARTECEIEQMNSEYSMRVSEKAIINFLDDYCDGIAEDILALNKAWGTDTVKTINYAIRIGLRLHKEAQTQWKEKNND